MGGRLASWAVRPSDAGAREVAAGLWRLRLPLPWPQTPHVNAYALEAHDGGIVLVDCGGAGHPTAWDALVAALADAGHAPQDVRELILTHVHSDHMGLAARVREASGCRIRAHAARGHVFDVAADPAGTLAARERRALTAGAPADRLDHYASIEDELAGIGWPVEIAGTLADGDRIDTAHAAWEVVETPGHAPSHVCLVDAEGRWALTADLVTAVFSPSFDLGYTHDPVGEWRASLERLRGRGIGIALPGHGRPIDGLDTVIDEHVAALAERLAACERAVAGAGATCHEAMRRLYPDDVASGRDVWRLPEVGGYLTHLVAQGRVQRLPGDVERFRAQPQPVGEASAPPSTTMR